MCAGTQADTGTGRHEVASQLASENPVGSEETEKLVPVFSTDSEWQFVSFYTGEDRDMQRDPHHGRRQQGQENRQQKEPVSWGQGPPGAAAVPDRDGSGIWRRWMDSERSSVLGDHVVWEAKTNFFSHLETWGLSKNKINTKNQCLAINWRRAVPSTHLPRTQKGPKCHLDRRVYHYSLTGSLPGNLWARQTPDWIVARFPPVSLDISFGRADVEGSMLNPQMALEKLPGLGALCRQRGMLVSRNEELLRAFMRNSKGQMEDVSRKSGQQWTPKSSCPLEHPVHLLRMAVLAYS